MQAWCVSGNMVVYTVYAGMAVYAKDTLECLLYIHTLQYSNTVNIYVHMHEQLVCSNFHTIYNLYSYTVCKLYNKHVHMYEWLVLYYSNSIGIQHLVWSHIYTFVWMLKC